MKKLIMTFLLLVIFFYIGFSQTADIKSVFKKGEIYQTEINFEQTVRTTRVEIPQHMLIVTDVEILEVNNEGDATMKMTCTRVKFVQKSSGIGIIAYDSDAKEEINNEYSLMLAKSLSKLVNASVTCVMTNRGKLKELLNYDNSLKEAFEQQLNSFFAYPNTSLEIGASWIETHSQTSAGITMLFESKYTLKEKVGKDWKIEVIAKINDEKGQQIGASTSELLIQEDNAFILKNITCQSIDNLKKLGTGARLETISIVETKKK